MKDDSLLRFHADTLKRYALFWEAPEDARAADVTPEVAAYHFLEHAAMLARYSDEPYSIAALKTLDRENRKRLIQAASRYISSITLADQCEELLRSGPLDTEQLDQLEAVLCRRFALDAVLESAMMLAGDLMEDVEVVRALGVGYGAADCIDEALEKRPQDVALASRTLLDTPGPFPVWLKQLRELDELGQIADLRPLLLHGLHAEGTARRPAFSRSTSVRLQLEVASVQNADPQYSMAADSSLPSSTSRVLHIAGGYLIEYDDSTRRDCIELQFVGPRKPAGPVTLSINQVPLTLVEPFDANGVACARAEDIRDALEGRATLEMNVVENA